MWQYILIFIISSLTLARSGVWLVKSLTGIAQFLGWKEFIVSSVLMAFSTSLPEIFIGLSSSAHGKSELLFGMVLGSNIIALTLLIGSAAIYTKGLTFKGKTLQKASLYAGFYGLLPLLLILDKKLSRIDGVVLILGLIVYFTNLLSEEERFSKAFLNNITRDWDKFKVFLKNLALFALSTGILLISCEGTIFSATKLAEFFDLPLVIIGAILVAFGTSLPEISFGIRSIVTGHKDMVLGNAMGSVVINSTLVLGLAAIISPINIPDLFPYFKGIIFTLLTCSFFVLFARTDRKITKKEAYFLIGIYFLFIVFQLFL